MLRIAYRAAPLICFGVPFLATFSFIFNHFFNTGAFFLDSGFFADLMWHKGWGLPNPAVALVAPDFPPRSYYGIHFSPLLAMISQITWWLPFDHVDIFATYMGLAQGLLGFVMWRLMIKLPFQRDAAWAAVATLLSVAFAMNGLVLGIITYPHIELLIPPLLLATLCLLLEDKFLAAAVVCGLALVIREDVGFHFFAVASLVVLLNWWGRREFPSQRALIIFAAAAFTYSCIAITVQHYFFASHSTFSWVYVGHPPFAHLTPEFVATRVASFFDARLYIWLPLLLICISTILFRNWYAMVGVVSVLPWLLLHLLAQSDAAGMLSIHYTFPIVVGVGWSILAIVYDTGREARRSSTLVKLFFIAGIVGSTFVANPAVTPFFREAVPSELALKPQRTREFMNALAHSLPLLGELRADTAIISLRPRLFTPSVWLLPQDWNGQGKPPRNIDALVYFRHGLELGKALVQLGEMGKARLFEVPGTRILIAIVGDVDPAAPISPFLHPIPDPSPRTRPLFVGFYEDPSLRWARTRSPFVSFVQCDAKNVRLEIVGYPHWPRNESGSPDSQILRVEVTVNGKLDRTLEFTPTTRQQVIDLPVVCIDDEMLVGFSYDHLIAPSEDGHSKDARKLGIGLLGEPTFD
jgi:hypothetical protein